METHVKAIGGLLTGLALLHVVFPRYFKWAEDLKPLTLINRQLMYIYTLFIALVVLLMGLLCWSCAPELVSTPLGRKVALGLGIFWLTRLLVQFFGYSRLLWQGKRLETAVHVVFALLWTYLTVVFFAVALGLRF